MTLENGISYFLQGNAGGDQSPFMKVDSEGNVVVGQEENPSVGSGEYDAHVFTLEEDPNGGTGIISNLNSKYLGFLESGDIYVAVCLSDEINGFNIEANGDYFNIIEGTEDGSLVLLSLASAEIGTQATQLKAKDDNEKNNPPQKWIFTQVPPIKI